MTHFHQELVSCPTLGTMIEVAPRHGVVIMSANMGIWPWIKSMFNKRRVLVGVNAWHGDLGYFWDAMREERS